jgi:ribosomal protein S18 acetylase RimI-like enzyme
MAIEIEIRKSEQADIDEIVQFTLEAEKQLDTKMRCGSTREEVEKFVRGALSVEFYYIIARNQGAMVGLAGLQAFSESMIYLDSWHPLVPPHPGSDGVLSRLVEESISFTLRTGRSRLEVFLMGITDESRHIYDKVAPLYESGGMRRGNEWSQMWCDLTMNRLAEPDMPDGFSLRPMIEVSNDDIWPCYDATFLTSGDRRYLSQTEAQRRENFEEFFDRSKQIEEDASLLLYSGDDVVGFMKVNLGLVKDAGFVNGIGVHPDYRRRGFGRALMATSLVRAARNGMGNMVLEVDIENRGAIALYESLGFKKRRGSISHVWTL